MRRIQVLGLDIYGCREALERLDDYTDRELSFEETQKVSQHLQICRECARKFAFEEELVAGVRVKAQQIALPAEMDAFKAKIAAVLQKESESRGSQE